MSRIGRLPIPVPSGVDVHDRRPRRHGEGPQGHADAHRRRARSRSSAARTARCRSTRPDDERANRALHGLSRTLVANMVTGVTDGYTKTLEIVGVGYRVAGQGQRPRVRARLQPPRAGPGARGHHLRRRDARPGSRCPASTSSRSARSPPTSASCASPTRTRARACATRASRSAARSERLGSSHGSWQSRSAAAQEHVARARRHLRVRKKVSGTHRAPAPGRDPLQPARVRAGRRRRRRPHPGLRLDDGGRPARPRRRQDRQGAPGRRAASPSGPRTPASRRWCSTGAATATTAGSPRSPTAPARRAVAVTQRRLTTPTCTSMPCNEMRDD